MRSAILIALLTPGIVFAEDTVQRSPDLESAVQKGLDFIAKDAVKWKNDHQCVSCHHAALTVWSMHEAKRAGRSVDEAVLAEMTKWMAESGEGKSSQQRPEGRPKAINTKALYFALALGSDPNPDPVSQEGLKKMLKTVKEDQLEDGSWQAWPETRPPFFGGSDDSMTGIAILAASVSEAEQMRTVRDRGVRWMTETKSDDDPQSLALRLLIWLRVGKPREECDQLAHKISSRQREDGGWSQAPEMTSDAWATGQALYALSNAGWKPENSTIERGRGFLIRTQLEDGSWPMTSRPTKPGSPGSTNLVPIIGGGSAWGVMGLVRSF